MRAVRLVVPLVVALLASAAARAQVAPVLTLTLQPTKAFRFLWSSVPGTTHYRLLEDPTGSAGFAQVGGDIAASATALNHVVPLYRRVNARYVLQACNASACSDSNIVAASAPLTRAIGYFKALNVGAFDSFGYAVALSSDGTTLAVGAIGEDSGAVGVNGNMFDNSVSASGAVYVFVRDAGSNAWVQQAYVKASNTGRDDFFGLALTLSANGSMLAVGAPLESSAATGVNGDQSDNSALQAGAVYVYARAGTTWAQQAYIKASNAEEGDRFGCSVAFSADARTLVIGAYGEDSSAVGVDGDQSDSEAAGSGAAYVFTRTGSAWSQQAYLKASNTWYFDSFGTSVDVSNDGSMLVVGAPRADHSFEDTGGVYVFARLAGSLWVQEAFIGASNGDDDSWNDEFGSSVALAGNGEVLAVGAAGESSGAAGINGDQSDNSASGAGAVYVFGRRDSVWTQQAYIKASNPEEGDGFGGQIAISNDGATLAVGAMGEDSNATGIDGDAANNATANGGAVYVFGKNNGRWTQRSYVKPLNTALNMAFTRSLALAGNGGTLAVGASNEHGGWPGINPWPIGLHLFGAGAVYVY